MQRAVHCNFCFAHRQLLQLPTVHRHHPTGICQQSNRCKLGRVPFLRASLPLFLIFPLSGSFVLTAGQANLGPATLLTLIASRGKRALRPTEREKNANTRKVPRSTMASSPMDSRAKNDYRGGKTREGETQKKKHRGAQPIKPRRQFDQAKKKWRRVGTTRSIYERKKMPKELTFGSPMEIHNPPQMQRGTQKPKAVPTRVTTNSRP